MSEHSTRLIESIEAGRMDQWRDYRVNLKIPIDLRNIDLSRFSARQHDSLLEQFDLSDCDLTDAVLTSIRLKNLTGAILTRAKLSSARLLDANLQFALLENAVFRDAKLSRADFSYAVFQGTNLTEATLDETNLFGAIGLDKAECLINMGIVSPGGALKCSENRHCFKFAPPTEPGILERAAKNDRFNIAKVSRWVTWERLRSFGQLPFFGASTSIFMGVPPLVLAIKYYNEGLDIVLRIFLDAQRNLAQVLQLDSGTANITSLEIALHEKAEQLKAHVPLETVLLLFSSLLLFFASILLSWRCPDIVRQFTYESWVFELGKDPVLYVPASESYRKTRLLTGFLYYAGAIIGMFYLCGKLWDSVKYIIGNL